MDYDNMDLDEVGPRVTVREVRLIISSKLESPLNSD